MHKTFLSSLALALSLIGTPALRAEPAPLAHLEIRGLDCLGDKVQELSGLLGKPVSSDTFQSAILNFIGTPFGLGLELSRNFRLHFFWDEDDDAANDDAICLELPTSGEGAETYLATLARNWHEPTGDNYADDLPSGFRRFDSGIFGPVLVAPCERTALLLLDSPADSALRVKNAVAALPPVLPVQGDIALWTPDVAAAGERISDIFSKGFAGNLLQSGDDSSTTLFADAAVGLAAGDGRLSLQTRATPRPGAPTDLAASIGPVSPAARALNIPGALCFFCGSDLCAVNPDIGCASLADLLPENFGPLFGTSGNDALARIGAFTDSHVGTDYAFALLPPAPGESLRAYAFLSLLDAPAVRDAFARLVAKINARFAACSCEHVLRLEGDPGGPFALQRLSLTPAGIDRVRKRLEKLGLGGLAPLAEKSLSLVWRDDGVLASTTAPDALLAFALALQCPAEPPAPTDTPAFRALFPSIPEYPCNQAVSCALFDIARAYARPFAAKIGDPALLADAETFLAGLPATPGFFASEDHLENGVAVSNTRMALADVFSAVRQLLPLVQKAFAPAAAPSGGYMAYTVQDGDTLDSLSLLFLAEPEEIRFINDIPEGADVEPGQILRIPAPR